MCLWIGENVNNHRLWRRKKKSLGQFAPTVMELAEQEECAVTARIWG